MCLVSCKVTPNSTPPVPAEKMQKVLLDLHVAEVYSSMLDDSLHQARNKNMDSLAGYYSDVFAHHHITREEFAQGVEWYKKHPSEMDSLYKNLVRAAGEMETRAIK